MTAAAMAEAPSTRKGRAKPGPALVDTAAWPYHFEIVELSELAVDDAYQRPLTDFWHKVRDNFDPALVGTLVVSERSTGKRFIIDGQPRWEAMKHQPELTGAPCLIYTGLSRAQEADLFAKLQTQRRGRRSYHRFRAQLIAKEPLAVRVAKVVQECGFVLGVHQETYTMSAIAALEKVYKIAPEHLADVLMILRDVWGTENKEAVS